MRLHFINNVLTKQDKFINDETKVVAVNARSILSGQLFLNSNRDKLKDNTVYVICCTPADEKGYDFDYKLLAR